MIQSTTCHVWLRIASSAAALGVLSFASPCWAIPGHVSSYDQNRYFLQQASGDFNGDGYIDCAFGNPEESATSTTESGVVYVTYGTSVGEDACDDVDNAETWDRETSHLLGSEAAYNWFGSSVAVGDLDGDGYDDLAVGAPGDDGPSANNVGSVTVIYGSPSGLLSTGNQLWTQDSPGVNDISEQSDYFGESLAIGDFNCDGYGDLAVGVAEEGIGSDSDAGAVNVLFGSSSGLSASGDMLLSEDTPGVIGHSEAYDSFGGAVAAGQLGDPTTTGCDDLVVGGPGETISGNYRAGVVHVFYGSTSGPSTSNDEEIHQDTSGVIGTTAALEDFGAEVLVWDDNQDGQLDLLVKTPNESCNGTDGAWYFFSGGTTGIDYSDQEVICIPSSGFIVDGQPDFNYGFWVPDPSNPAKCSFDNCCNWSGNCQGTPQNCNHCDLFGRVCFFAVRALQRQGHECQFDSASDSAACYDHDC